MSNEQSIRDEIASALIEGIKETSEVGVWVDKILDSPVIRRIQAEALREAADDWHEKHAGTRPAPYLFMVDRADRIERGETA